MLWYIHLSPYFNNLWSRKCWCESKLKNNFDAFPFDWHAQAAVVLLNSVTPINHSTIELFLDELIWFIANIDTITNCSRRNGEMIRKRKKRKKQQIPIVFLCYFIRNCIWKYKLHSIRCIIIRTLMTVERMLRWIMCDVINAFELQFHQLINFQLRWQQYCSYAVRRFVLAM